jgi:hypothetical protein
MAGSYASVAKAHSNRCFELDKDFNLQFNDRKSKIPGMDWAHVAFLSFMAVITILVIVVATK